MRGLYFLAFLAILGAVSGRTSSSKHALPDYMNGMSPQEIKREVLALASKEYRSSLEDAMLAVIYQFQELMQEGLPQFGIPPLDPLFIPQLNFNLSSDLIALEGFIAQTTVQQMSVFNVTNLQISPLRLSLDLSYLWKAINFGGLYDIDGVLTVLPIYGAGPYTLSLNDMSMSATLTLGTRVTNGTVYIKEFLLDMYLDSVTNNFEGLMGGGEMSQIVNDMITDMAPELFNSVKDQILGPISQLITNKVNAVLSEYTMAELIDIIMGIGGGGNTTPAT